MKSIMKKIAAAIFVMACIASCVWYLIRDWDMLREDVGVVMMYCVFVCLNIALAILAAMVILKD